MTTEQSAIILPSELTQVVESLFGAMLRLEVTECSTPWFPGLNRLTASVHLTGDWEGAVLIECDQSQACGFAGRFLSMDRPAEVDDLVRDVLGEMANMIGGNLKCVLTQGIKMSIPSVIDGGNYTLRVCGTQICQRVSFHCDEGTFWVTVLGTRP